MTTAFASLRSRINFAVLSKLADESATVGGVSVSGIFNNGYNASGLGMAGFEATQPSLTCLVADVPSVAHGNSVVVAAGTFKVAEIEPDGSGFVKLVLKK